MCAKRTRKKFDQMKVVLLMKFMSLGCTMVTLRSETLLYINTSYSCTHLYPVKVDLSTTNLFQRRRRRHHNHHHHHLHHNYHHHCWCCCRRRRFCCCSAIVKIYLSSITNIRIGEVDEVEEQGARSKEKGEYFGMSVCLFIQRCFERGKCKEMNNKCGQGSRIL